MWAGYLSSFSGARIPWASSPKRPSRALAGTLARRPKILLRDQPLEAKLALIPTPLFLQGPKQSSTSRSRPNFPCRVDTLSAFAFHKVGEASQPRTDSANSWASSRNSSPTLPPLIFETLHFGLPPTAPREAAVTDEPGVLSFYFRSLLSAPGKTAKYTVGAESNVLTK